MFFKKSFVILT